MWKSLGIFDVFDTLTLKEIFLKTETFLKKLENRFLVQSATNESATFPYKTALPKANVKTNWIGSTKWTYHKECTFATDYFLFFENLS